MVEIPTVADSVKKNKKYIGHLPSDTQNGMVEIFIDKMKHIELYNRNVKQIDPTAYYYVTDADKFMDYQFRNINFREIDDEFEPWPTVWGLGLILGETRLSDAKENVSLYLTIKDEPNTHLIHIVYKTEDNQIIVIQKRGNVWYAMNRDNYSKFNMSFASWFHSCREPPTIFHTLNIDDVDKLSYSSAMDLVGEIMEFKI